VPILRKTGCNLLSTIAIAPPLYLTTQIPPIVSSQKAALIVEYIFYNYKSKIDIVTLLFLGSVGLGFCMG
jgi:hypothetical protein